MTTKSNCLLALDSDGTVLDSMDAKHELGFFPAFADFFAGDSSTEALASIWRFVNLRSRLRGVNRYRALSAVLRLASRHPETSRTMRRYAPLVSALDAWLAVEEVPSAARLSSALADKRGDFSHAVVLAWSRRVDELVAALPMPPAFPTAARTLMSIAGNVEIVVVSAAPEAVVAREWAGAGLGSIAAKVYGQEHGTKAACLSYAIGRQFSPERVLLVGDAPGDLEASKIAGISFFPIVPGSEEGSWKHFADQYFPAFVAGRAAHAAMGAFMEALPQDPPWQ